MRSPRRAQPLTVEALYTMPDDGRKYELEAGMLVAEPLPGFRHGRVMFVVARILDAHVERHGLGMVIVGDAGFVLARAPDTVRGPDVAYVAQRRVAGQLDRSKAFEGAPDLAVEVLSPTNTPAEVHAKVGDYLAAGTRSVWVVDSERRTVAVYESLLSPRVLAEQDILVAGDVVPGFSVRVGELFEV